MKLLQTSDMYIIMVAYCQSVFHMDLPSVVVKTISFFYLELSYYV